MKTNKISAMLLSAAIACTPVLSSAAQIVASAEETTTATTTEAAEAAEAAVAVPVAVDPAAVVVAAETDPTTEPATAAPSTAAAPASNNASATTTTATTVAQKVGNAEAVSPEVDNNYAAGKAMVKGMAEIYNVENKDYFDQFDLPTASGIGVALTKGERAAFKNPNFNGVDEIYGFRMPNANEGKMLYTPNPRWFINTPSPACVGGSGESGTITWDPVPMADGYRYTIRTYVIDDSADSHDYSFEHTHNGYPTAGNTKNVPKSVGVDAPGADYKAQDDNPACGFTPVTDAKGNMLNAAGTVVYYKAANGNMTDAAGNVVLTKDANGNLVNAGGNVVVDKDGFIMADADGKGLLDAAVATKTKSMIMTGDLQGVLTDSAVNKTTSGEYNVDRYPTKFRVKEDFSINGKWQEQDATTNYTVKENWREFNNVDKNLVVGYTYNLEKPSVTVSADVPVRVEIMIQAFRIDNKTGELYNLSAVSEPRVVDLNWVAKESWEGMLGAPDQYEDEFFRAGYHKLDEPKAPEKYEVEWKTVTLPITKEMVEKGLYTLQAGERIDEISGYVVEPGNLIDDPTNKDAKIPSEQVKYDTFPKRDAAGNVDASTILKEVFNLKDYKSGTTPSLYDVSDGLKNSGTSGAQRWKLNSSINQALKDDASRKDKAYAEWKKQELDPISKWNTDHADQISKAWRTAYKEAIKAYAQSEFVNNKSLSMRYGLLDLDRNGVPELIVSFSSKADKNSYIVLDFQGDRAKLRTVHDKYRTEWYYEDVLGGCARRGRCFKLDNLAPIDSWTAADDEKDPLASTSTGSGSSSASSSASSSSGSSSSSSSSSSSDAGAPKTGDAGVAGLVAAAAAAVAGIFASRRKKD